MATKQTYSVTAPNPPCRFNGPPFDGNLIISGVTGATMFIAGHTTEVSVSFHCPPASAAKQTIKAIVDTVTGNWTLLDQFNIAEDFCGTTVGPVPAALKVEHRFKSTSGGADQVLLEVLPVTIDCPLAACVQVIINEVKTRAREQEKSARKPARKVPPRKQKPVKSKKAGKKKKK